MFSPTHQAEKKLLEEHSKELAKHLQKNEGNLAVEWMAQVHDTNTGYMLHYRNPMGFIQIKYALTSQRFEHFADAAFLLFHVRMNVKVERG